MLIMECKPGQDAKLLDIKQYQLDQLNKYPSFPLHPYPATMDKPVDPELLHQCAKCGACTSVCPVYRVTGRESLTARGKLHILSRLVAPGSAVYSDILSKCLLCGACSEVCARRIDITSLLISARSSLSPRSDKHFLAKLSTIRSLGSPALLSGLSSLSKIAGKTLQKLPADSGLRRKLSFLNPDLISQSHTRNQNLLSRLQPGKRKKQPTEFAYFAGCLATHLYPDIASSVFFLAESLHSGKIDRPANQACCGLAAMAGGNLDEARRLAKKNIHVFSSHSLPILTSCASCFKQLKKYPDLFSHDPCWHEKAKKFSGRVVEFSSFFHRRLKEKFSLQSDCHDLNKKSVYYHDPCHLRFGSHQVVSEPRKLLTKITRQPPVELALGPQCCGQGGLFHLSHPDLSSNIFSHLLDQVGQTTAETIVTTCSGCLLQWQQGQSSSRKTYQVKHLACYLSDFFTEAS